MGGGGGGTHHRGEHHSRHHAGWYAPHRMPHLPGLKRSPESNLDITRESQFDQYNEWTEAPVKLQVVDPVGVPILVGDVTRDTTIDQLRNKVEAAVRERHAAVLSGPRHSEGGGHRTYTVLAELGLYKIKNYDDAFSGNLRELFLSERLDGQKRKIVPADVLEYWKQLGERTKTIKAKAGMTPDQYWDVEELKRRDEYKDLGRSYLKRGPNSRLWTSQPTAGGVSPALIEYWSAVAQIPISEQHELEVQRRAAQKKKDPASIVEDGEGDPRLFCPLHPDSMISNPKCCIIRSCGHQKWQSSQWQCSECLAMEKKWKKTTAAPAKLGFLLAPPRAPQVTPPFKEKVIEVKAAEAIVDECCLSPSLIMPKYSLSNADVLPPEGDEPQEHDYDGYLPKGGQQLTEEQLALASELPADASEAARAGPFSCIARESLDAVGNGGHGNSDRVIKLLYKADMHTAKSHSSRHFSWTETWTDPSWTSSKSSSWKSGGSGGDSGGSCGGGSCGGGSGGGGS